MYLFALIGFRLTPSLPALFIYSRNLDHILRQHFLDKNVSGAIPGQRL